MPTESSKTESSKLEERDLLPIEVGAIFVRKYYMSLERGKEVSFEDARDDFFEKYMDPWKRKLLLEENLAQKEEIDNYRKKRTEELGYDPGEAAAEEWIERYAAEWREQKDKVKRDLEKNGFQEVRVLLTHEKGLHLRASKALAIFARRFYCEVYARGDNMEKPTMIMNGKGYSNAKSVLELLALGVQKGDYLEFVACGKEAQPALEEIVKFITEDRFEANYQQ